MFSKSDNWYRHWFLNEIMKVNLLLKVSADSPVRIDFILKRAKNHAKADKAYYYLFADKSVLYRDFNNIDHVVMTDKGRNELLGEYYLAKEREQRTLTRNNNLLVFSNVVMALGVIGTFILWAKPNLRQSIIEWLKERKGTHTQQYPLHLPSKTPPPNLHKTFVIDSASQK